MNREVCLGSRSLSHDDVGFHVLGCRVDILGTNPYPILPPSLISHTVSVDIKHHGRRRRRSDLSHLANSPDSPAG